MRKFENFLWIAFLVWTAVGAIVMPLGLGEADVTLRNEGLREALAYILRVSDAVWIVLAASVVYLFILQDAGHLARAWAGVIILCSAVLEIVGATTGYPFGPYAYTSNMGAKLFGIMPFTIPLAWLIILMAGRYAVLWWRPQATRLQIATGTAAIALLTDINLEFIAWKVRVYWIWYPPGTPLGDSPPAWPPLQNYISWFVFSFLITLLLPQLHLAPQRNPMRVIGVLLAMNALFLLVHTVRFIRFGGY